MLLINDTIEKKFRIRVKDWYPLIEYWHIDWTTVLFCYTIECCSGFVVIKVKHGSSLKFINYFLSHPIINMCCKMLHYCTLLKMSSSSTFLVKMASILNNQKCWCHWWTLGSVLCNLLFTDSVKEYTCMKTFLFMTKVYSQSNYSGCT